MAEILVVVDMQNDFVSGVLGTQEAFDIVPNVVGRVVDALNRGETVLFTRDTRAGLPEHPGRQAPAGTPLHPGDGRVGDHSPAAGVCCPSHRQAHFWQPVSGNAAESPGRRSAPAGPAGDREGHIHWRVHGYLRDFQCFAGQGVFAGGGDRGGCCLLCRCDAGEPPHGSAGNESLPDHRGA